MKEEVNERGKKTFKTKLLLPVFVIFVILISWFGFLEITLMGREREREIACVRPARGGEMLSRPASTELKKREREKRAGFHFSPFWRKKKKTEKKIAMLN